MSVVFCMKSGKEQATLFGIVAALGIFVRFTFAFYCIPLYVVLLYVHYKPNEEAAGSASLNAKGTEKNVLMDSVTKQKPKSPALVATSKSTSPNSSRPSSPVPPPPLHKSATGGHSNIHEINEGRSMYTTLMWLVMTPRTSIISLGRSLIAPILITLSSFLSTCSFIVFIDTLYFMVWKAIESDDARGWSVDEVSLT